MCDGFAQPKRQSVLAPDLLPSGSVKQEVADLARVELTRATAQFGPMASAHEGWAVIKEELDELWEEIRADQDPDRMREEAIQVAAMAMRFVVDVCPVHGSQQPSGDAFLEAGDPSAADPWHQQPRGETE